NHNPCFAAFATASDQSAPAPRRVGALDYQVLFQRVGIDSKKRGSGVSAASGDFQRGFSQTIRGIEGSGLKTAGRKRRGKIFESVFAHRFSAAESDCPSAQVEALPLLGRNLPQAQLVGEIRPAAVSHPVAGNCFQPAERALKKRGRRHYERAKALEHRLNYAVDQAHVVEVRQPIERYALRIVLKSVIYIVRVGQEAPVAYHHTLGRGRRSRSVLK